jgi:EpsI family protein
VPIVANWLRAYMIVMIGHLSDNRLAVGVDHLIYGWVFFGVVIMLMFMIGARWAEPDEPHINTAIRAPAAGGPNVSATGARWWQAAVCGIAAAALGPVLILAMTQSEGNTPIAAWRLPADYGSRWAPSEDFTPWRPQMHKPSLEVRGAYRSAAGAVGVHIAQFRQQSYESKLVNSEHLLLRSEDTSWNKQQLEMVQLQLDGAPATTLRAFKLQGAPSLGRSDKPVLTVWQVYRVNGLWMTSDYLAKIHTAMARLAGKGDDGALVLLYSASASGADGTALLESFARENLPAIAAQVDASARTR